MLVPTTLFIASVCLSQFSWTPPTASAFSFFSVGKSTTTKSLKRQAKNSDTNDEEGTASSSSFDGKPLSIGFIGFGTIAYAIARGFTVQSTVPIQRIAVSRRSESKSLALQASFPDLVSIHENNQEIVDSCDIVFVCVLPTQCSSVLEQLQFQSKNKRQQQQQKLVVSLVSTSTLSQLATDTKLSPNQIFKCICLPAVATCNGVCLVTPKQYYWKEDTTATTTNDTKNPRLDSTHYALHLLLDSLGGTVLAENEQEMSAMMVPSGLMGIQYGIMKQSRDYVLANTSHLTNQEATFLVSRLFYGMILDANNRSSNIDHSHDEEDLLQELIAEQTPGGLNEQALQNLRLLGMEQQLKQTQDAMLDRIMGRSKGQLRASSSS